MKAEKCAVYGRPHRSEKILRERRLEHIEQDSRMAQRPRPPRRRRFRALDGDVKQRLDQIRDQIRDPILSVLTILLAFMMFMVVPLHAAGVISARGYGLAIVLLLTSCVLVQSRRQMAIVLTILALALAIVALAIRLRFDSAFDLYLEAGACLIVSVLLIFVIARAVFAPGRVSYHRVNGAVLLYLTIGMTFVALYTFVGLLTRNAFSSLSVVNSPELASEMIYFSFVTLTTVGYGDIVPVHPVARGLCNLEAIIGQLYPATLLARLVTLELEGRRIARGSVQPR